MLQRSLTSIVLWTLVWAPALAQEPGGLMDPMMPSNRISSTTAGDEPAVSYRLTGTLVSPSGRVAILNGRLYQEGERVDDATILAIDAGVVRLGKGSQELTVYLGSRSPTSRLRARVSRGPEPSQPLPEPGRADAVSAQSAALPPMHGDGRYGPVKHGETLSEIAQRNLRDGITMDQMMIALYRANPHAFSGNINVLHEGAVLRIPGTDLLAEQPPELATVEVSQQMLDWRDGGEQLANAVEDPARGSYGPVQRGETLSEIAQRNLRDGVTMDQMMIALYRANPHAFSGNINVLHEGAVLRIPGTDLLAEQPPELAAVEVARQIDAWRAGEWRQARLSSAPSHETRFDRAEDVGVIVSTNRFEPPI